MMWILILLVYPWLLVGYIDELCVRPLRISKRKLILKILIHILFIAELIILEHSVYLLITLGVTVWLDDKIDSSIK